MTKSQDKFYITTPIYYPNDVPHIGHTGTTVFADIIARYQRALGKDVFFLTGTDEHGEKLANAAQKSGKTPKEFVDELSEEWKKIWAKLSISNDEFIRTTMPGHEKVVQELVDKLYKKGDIYKGVYKGVYCWGCEEFKSEKDLVDGKCPEHRPDQVEYREEENYFFKISNYIPKIIELYEKNELSIEPENKKNEMLSRMKQGVDDLSASRKNVTWGIPVPWDDSQTIYVWVDALINYYSATRIYEEREDFWPADVHFLGKGNNWFHSVIWPALLLALDLPLPKRVYVHGYYNVDGKKMGKSLGNVISPEALLERYGSDGTRYLLAASMPYLDDSDVSFKWFDDKYNADLANGFGNLVHRVGTLAKGKDLGLGSYSKTLKDVIEENPAIKEAYDNFKLHVVVEEVQKFVKQANEYLTKEAPWKVADEEKKLEILQESAAQILYIAQLLEPITPDAVKWIREGFISDTVSSEILFQRVE